MAAALVSAPACSGQRREPFATFFSAEHGVSIRYPASWGGEEAEQDGVWYRYFLGPVSGKDRKPEVSATLFAGPLGTSLEQYAQSYLAGNSPPSARDEARGPAHGRSWEYASADGATRFSLLLLEEGGRAIGLYCQGRADVFEHHRQALGEMAKSLTLERPADWPLHQDEHFGYTLRVPASWKAGRTFSSGGTLMTQWTSPALGADKGGATVHAGLTLSVETLAAETDLAAFWAATRQKLGESYQMLSHKSWREGYADQMRSETSVTVGRVKRFYRVAGGRGYILACEARDDVFHRVSRWCDAIAGTFEPAPAAGRP